MRSQHLRDDCRRCGVYLDGDNDACRACLAWAQEQEASRNAAQVDILIQHKARRDAIAAPIVASPLPIDPPLFLDDEPIVLLAPPPPVPLVPATIPRPHGLGGVGSPCAAVACAIATLLASAWLFSGPLLLRLFRIM